MPKYFKLEEANRMLPLLRRIVQDIVGAHGQLLQKVEEYRSPSMELDLSGERRRELEIELQELTDRVNGYVGELEGLGVEFKGFEEGLVDFHATLDGRPVFLCWKLGEESIEWWHEEDAGYAGRQRLPAQVQGTGGGR
ncbi:MAG: DUF2203 domain-containing protein [Gemmatimonadota bacterium]|nr:MAG: DUF2203 domain-containing protein [Gemmatimonadota bacterium]